MLSSFVTLKIGGVGCTNVELQAGSDLPPKNRG